MYNLTHMSSKNMPKKTSKKMSKKVKPQSTRAKKPSKKNETNARASTKHQKSEEKSEPSYVITKPKLTSDKILFGVLDNSLRHDHPASNKLVREIEGKIQSATLSAQAEASIYKDDLAERVPRSEAMDHMKLIKSIARTAELAGSFRRGVSLGNDIDIVIREPIDHVIAQLHSLGYIKHTFSAGQHKFSGVVKHPAHDRHRHLDIIMTNEQSYPFAMLYFTGSERHNIIMRLKARKLGLKLNEYGLFRDNKPVSGITSEQDIFAALGIPYKEPSERN
jgi:DNA polymerase/3'-5' exonuclease PolX